MSDFDLFGSGSDSDESATTPTAAAAAPARTLDNGLLQSHNGTEQALLLYVKRELAAAEAAAKNQLQDDDDQPAGEQVIVQKCLTVLSLIDRFCKERHWYDARRRREGRDLEQSRGAPVLDWLGTRNKAKCSRSWSSVSLEAGRSLGTGEAGSGGFGVGGTLSSFFRRRF